MNNSLKTGIISGLIAGLIAGIVTVLILVPLIFKLDFPSYYWLPPPPETPFIKIAITEITLAIIWGIFLGIIYSKIYDLIPGKGVSKGLIFGLGYYLILSIRWVIFSTAYGNFDAALGNLLLIFPIVYGIVLGILYKAPKEKLKIKKHEIMSGVIPGAITGLIFSIAVIIAFITAAYFGFIFGFQETLPDYLTDIEFIISQYGSHAVINMFFMSIFGAFYVTFYDRIPGKGLVKGAIFGLIIWIIIDLQTGLIWFVYGNLGMAMFSGLVALDIYIFFGLVLEGLYKKRSSAILWAGGLFIIGNIMNIFLSALGFGWGSGFANAIVFGLALGLLYKKPHR